MKKYIIFIIFLVACMMTLKYVSKSYRNTDTLLCRISNILNWDNTIDVDYNSDNKKNIKVFLLSYESRKEVYSNGKQTAKIPQRYGGYYFDVYDEHKKIYSTRVFSTNNWHSFDFTLKINKEGADYAIDFICDGPDC